MPGSDFGILFGAMTEQIRAYKVVTENLQSLGLRKNPNIMDFKVGEWVILPVEEIEPGKGDWGGVWSAKNLSGARKLQKYMQEKHDIPTRIFAAELQGLLYSNSYRVKSGGIKLLEEIH